MVASDAKPEFFCSRRKPKPRRRPREKNYSIFTCANAKLKAIRISEKRTGREVADDAIRLYLQKTTDAVFAHDPA